MKDQLNIVLIVPESGITSVYPPLGLGILAAISIQEGHRVKVYDFTLKTRGLKKDAEMVFAENPDLLGISANTHNFQNGLELARLIKTKKQIPIIMGGPHPSLFADEILAGGTVDFVIRGEGEITYKEFINQYNLQCDNYRGIRGLSYRENSTVNHNPQREFIIDLDNLPFPARHLFSDYHLRSSRNKKMATLITSRGCPFNCAFCYKGLFGNKFRSRSAENILDEIRLVVNDYGIKSFYFVDDLFTYNKERVKKICQMLIDEKLAISFQCLSRIDTVTPELLKLMKEAGCEKISYGIESADEDILKRICKRTTLPRVEETLKITSEAKILTKGYFMLGLPGDTDETITKTLNFAEKAKLDELMFSLTLPLPGSELWERVKDRVDKKLFSEMYYYNLYQNIVPVFNMADVSNEKLVSYMSKANRISLVKKYGKILGNIIHKASNLKLGRLVLPFFYGFYQLFAKPARKYN